MYEITSFTYKRLFVPLSGLTSDEVLQFAIHWNTGISAVWTLDKFRSTFRFLEKGFLLSNLFQSLLCKPSLLKLLVLYAQISNINSHTDQIGWVKKCLTCYSRKEPTKHTARAMYQYAVQTLLLNVQIRLHRRSIEGAGRLLWNSDKTFTKEFLQLKNSTSVDLVRSGHWSTCKQQSIKLYDLWRLTFQATDFCKTQSTR